MNEQTKSIACALLRRYIETRHEMSTYTYDEMVINKRYLDGLLFAINQIPHLHDICLGAYAMTSRPELDDQWENYAEFIDGVETSRELAFKEMIREIVASGIEIWELKSKWVGGE